MTLVRSSKFIPYHQTVVSVQADHCESDLLLLEPTNTLIPDLKVSEGVLTVKEDAWHR